MDNKTISKRIKAKELEVNRKLNNVNINNYGVIIQFKDSKLDKVTNLEVRFFVGDNVLNDLVSFLIRNKKVNYEYLLKHGYTESMDNSMFRFFDTFEELVQGVSTIINSDNEIRIKNFKDFYS